ncbi:MAG TPA: hypothetical protein VHM20_07020, partial [Gammaproteobacteria bacterium]|nr:hypothetical protein [Gammaproteobacteria bacterium]
METRLEAPQPTTQGKKKTSTETKDTNIVPTSPSDSLHENTFENKLENKMEMAPQEIGNNIADYIIPSAFSNTPAEKLPEEIVKSFNREVKSHHQKIIIEPGVWRSGQRIKPGQFFLAHKNKVPKIEIGNGRRLNVAFNLSPFTELDRIGTVEQSAPIFGAFGSYVLNVPPGQYAKAWSGNKPLFYGEGTHVIHDPLFRFDKSAADVVQSFRSSEHFSNQSDNYIQHGNFHVIRVLPGTFAKIFLNGKPELLAPRDKPYFFDSPLFKFNPQRDIIFQSENYIEHGNFHQLRVPPGKVAKILVNNIPQLLHPNINNTPYIINTPIFKFNPASDFVNETENYIRHETIHMVRVPPGYFAKVIVDNIPKLLPPTENNQPHTFHTTNFKFNPTTDCVNQNTSYITHGIRHILRLPKGSVAKAWYGNTPVLLERLSDEQDSKVYDFEDPQFRLEETRYQNKSFLFLSASEKLIEHGSRKRVIPPIGELAVINKNGKLEVVQGRYDTDSPTESVVGFFDTSVQTLEFPSKKTR